MTYWETRLRSEMFSAWVSPALREEGTQAGCLCHGEFQPMPFDAAGNLRQELLFPHSLRARRFVRAAG